ncbi:5'-3' exoribonuclease 2-like, partial [Liolophura sinensis]|uniref:5'-3' exoribonuclease 2-like n=1 Tax=Liolophura sinensis TaxID=3198878 RepID=UPI003158B739
MGVPAFFRWLSRKYPAILVNCVEEKPKQVGDVKAPVDSSQSNPNEVEFDNLYLDMNGIIHPCCHPEDRPAPKNEDEMMVLIFEYIDRIFSIVRPRKLLYMAIDGVAPRAKMNQQRSRRFRASKESKEKAEEITKVREELLAKGAYVPPEKPASEKFDSNCITPGTPFMFKLAECLRYYVHDRLNNDSGWKNIKVILSDANVPGEGEHKIMDYIRKQRGQPDHDPNTHHCLCGADADLIMLGLATHEPYFTIIREEFKPNKPRSCELCGQIGHELKECTGAAKEKQGEFDELPASVGEEQAFIFLRLNILREYLERELMMTGLPFTYDFERALDDWVFMCFFVGNDFLPHLPSLEIRENAIDRLINLYKKTVHKTGGYLTDSGVVNLSRVQLVMADLGEVEDQIFKTRRDNELNFRRRNKEKKKRLKQFKDRPNWTPRGQFAPQPIGNRPSPIHNPKQTAMDMRVQGRNYGTSADSSNKEAAAALRSMLKNGEESNEQRGEKRKSTGDDSDEEEEPPDNVRLWEDGWKERYYKNKFNVDISDAEFRHTVANHYVRGLCWVLRYYYQGCASWKWYFPYHYAPFASDFVNIGDLPNDFERNTEPFKPLEQLMSVFPAASKQHLPLTWQRLMEDPESPIIDFYPVDFKIDLNGKKYAWQGVALLPFVDEKRLKDALQSVYPDLTEDEKKRNVRGNDRLFVGQSHPVFSFLEGLYEGERTEEMLDINAKLTQGMAGKVACDEFAVMTSGTFKSPIPSHLPDLTENRTITVKYQDPQYEEGYLFQAKVLPNAKMPDKVLKPEDFNNRHPGHNFRPQLGFTKSFGHRGGRDSSTANRFIRHGLGSQEGQGGGYGRQHGQGYNEHRRQNSWDNARFQDNRGQGYGGGGYGGRGGGGGSRYGGGSR